MKKKPKTLYNDIFFFVFYKNYCKNMKNFFGIQKISNKYCIFV